MAKIDRYFSDLSGEEKIPSNILDVLFEIDDLFKLIKYNDPDPLNPSNSISDQEKRNMLIPSIVNEDRRIYFSMFNDNVIDDEQTQLRIYIARDTSLNNILSEILVGFDIVCHNNLTEIFDEDGDPVNRLLKMKLLILRALHGEVIENSIGILRIPDGSGSTLIPFNKSFQGYRFVMQTRSD